MPLSTQSPNTGLFSESVTIQAKTWGLVLLWKQYIYMHEMGLDWPILIAHSMGTIGKYIIDKKKAF